MGDYKGLSMGYPIHIVTKTQQCRKHHKRRINKKWRKRYGTIEYNSMPDGEVLYDNENKCFYMTKKTFEKYSKVMNEGVK